MALAKSNSEWNPMRSLWFIFFVLCSSGCRDGNPTIPLNANPTILSVEVFPSTIGRHDSTIVYCRAVDSDGDSLFYDWTADGRLNLQGVPPFFHSRFDSRSPTQVFYPAAVDSPSDTAWIESAVRDHRGGITSRLVRVIIRS